MFEVSTSYWSPRKGGWVRRKAQRTNGDFVYITGDTRDEVDHVRGLLMRLARRFKLPMMEIADMAEAVVIAMQNPDAPERVWGIAQAPRPYSKIDVGVAEEQFVRDFERARAILEDKDVGIEVIAWLAVWWEGWCMFWSVRHGDDAQREAYSAELAHNRSIRQPRIQQIIARRADG